MLNALKFPSNRIYKSGSKNEPFKFYLDCLLNSNRLDLLLGYFSSSAINVLSVGFASFMQRGGIVRLIINDVLFDRDKEAIQKGEEGFIKDDLIDLNNYENLKETLSKSDQFFFDCLAWLIKKDKIQFVIIKPKNHNGISHFKSGIFSDGSKEIGFKATCNFTATALLSNLEELSVIDPNDGSIQKSQIDEQRDYFSKTYSGKNETVEYLSSDKIKVAIKSLSNDKEIDELILDELELIDVKKKSEEYYTQDFLDIVKEELIEYQTSPKFPYIEGPRPYQKEAYKNWVANDYSGIFAMATGTGKTITSLNCLLKEYEKTRIYRAIITVPTIALVEQWKKECISFNFKNIITVSSREKWGNNLAFFNTASKLIDTSYIVIVTYASLPRKKFQSHFTQLPEDTIFIADETHNLGSHRLLKLLPNIHLKKRIGLSATPSRKFDEIGNQAIQRFFNDEPPYIVSFSMEEALKKRFLCSYKYYPHIVELTEQEMEKYKKLSLQLLRMGLFDKLTGNFRSTPEIEKKLLERKRIIHKATNKLDVFKAILRSEFDKRTNLKYTLIYVPEGVEANFDERDYSIETDEENKLINEYTKAVSNTDDSIMVKQFTANSENREGILKNYEEGRIHILTSMKCLDEGVDVPRSELAIFCASTGNPRQFIQRRGRVLRLHMDKIHATIHDLVVVPEIADESTYEMEKGLVKKELERVVDFANMAMNKIHTYETFKSILSYYNLNLNDL